MSQLRFLLRFYITLVAVFLVAKPLFMWANSTAADGVTLVDVFAVWRHGLPLDLATAAYLSAPLWLGLCVSLWWRMPFRRRAYHIYIGVASALLAVIYVSDACLYSFWGIKLDGTVFAYLDSPKGAAASVSLLYILGVCAAVIGTALVLDYLLRRLAPRRLTTVSRTVPAAAVALLAGGLLFLAIRGGVGKSTANVGMVYFSDRQFLNHSAVNPAFSIFSSLFKSRDFAAQYNFYPEAERARRFAALGYGRGDTEADKSLGDSLLTVKRPDVIVIVMEGCGGLFVHAVDSLADPGITPGLNRLAEEGITFTQCYANSFRTDRGMLCALSGYPSFPDVSVMKLPGKYGRLPGIASSLRRAGYTTEFLYGGDINFTNTNGYLMATGYERTYGDTAFTAAQRSTHNWGVTDSITFERLFDMAVEPKHDGPRHIGMLTLASHEPWGVPYNRIPDDPVANAMAYLDRCITRFVERLRATSQWENTLIVLVPDHGISHGKVLEADQPRRHKIPLIMLGGALARPLQVDKICNQTDLPATLLALLGLPHDEFRFSRNVLSEDYTRPSAVHTWSEGILWIDSTGTSSINLITNPPSLMHSHPERSLRREEAARVFLQTIYDDLGSL